MFDSRYIVGFAFGAGGVFLYFLFNGVVGAHSVSQFQAWLSSLSGWVAAGVAGYIGWTTLRPIREQLRQQTALARISLLQRELDASEKLMADLNRIHIFVGCVANIAKKDDGAAPAQLKNYFVENERVYVEAFSDFIDSFRSYLREGFIFDIDGVREVRRDKDKLDDMLLKFQNYFHFKQGHLNAHVYVIGEDAEKILKVIDCIVPVLSNMAGSAYSDLKNSKTTFRH